MFESFLCSVIISGYIFYICSVVIVCYVQSRSCWQLSSSLSMQCYILILVCTITIIQFAIHFSRFMCVSFFSQRWINYSLYLFTLTKPENVLFFPVWRYYIAMRRLQYFVPLSLMMLLQLSKKITAQFDILSQLGLKRLNHDQKILLNHLHVVLLLCQQPLNVSMLCYI